MQFHHNILLRLRLQLLRYILFQIHYLLLLSVFLQFQLMCFHLCCHLLFLYFLEDLLHLPRIHNSFQCGILRHLRLLLLLIHLASYLIVSLTILSLLRCGLRHLLLLPCNRFHLMNFLHHYIHLLSFVYYNTHFDLFLLHIYVVLFLPLSMLLLLYNFHIHLVFLLWFRLVLPMLLNYNIHSLLSPLHNVLAFQTLNYFLLLLSLVSHAFLHMLSLHIHFLVLLRNFVLLLKHFRHIHMSLLHLTLLHIQNLLRLLYTYLLMFLHRNHLHLLGHLIHYSLLGQSLLQLFVFHLFLLLLLHLYLPLLLLNFLEGLRLLLHDHNNIQCDIQLLRRLLQRLIHLVNLFQMLIIILILLLCVLHLHLQQPCNRMSPFQNLLHYTLLCILYY